MVLEAAEAEASGVAGALSELCQQYWFPLYAFVRRKGFDRSEAEDLTQGFFADLLEKKRLLSAEPSRGSFRSFLLASLSNFIANHWRAESAQKRGGGKTILSIDYQQADNLYAGQPSDGLTAEKIFERNWALSILEQSLQAVGEQYEQSGKRELFESLKGFLTGYDNAPYAELAEKTGMRENAIKVAVHRLRQRYGQQLRLQIAKTVQDPADVDQELKSLFQALE
jgi:RNA polymerase sigma-70 factor (ECF subfamily)